MAYRYLWTPLELGPVTVRNRIVFSAHLTNYARDGKPTEQHAAYYGARAAGGAGLIVTEEHSTHPTDWPYEKLIHGFHRDVIPGYRRITEAVHRHRVPIFAQINHNGGQASSMYTRLPVWAPSPVADPLFREVPKAVTGAEIDEIVAGYATVAEHCAEGGFDGIELQCSHSSIVRGFLSPATNRRTDDYGGSLANRARLLLEIVAAVRRVIGNRLALGVRLCGDELIDGGTTIDEAVEVARMVEATGPGRLHQHVDRRGHGDAVHDRGVDARAARLRAVHPVGDPQGGRAARRRRRPVQGPAAGRAGARRGPLRPRRRRARPDRRRRVRGQGPGRGDGGDPPVPVVQPGVRRADGPQPLARAASRTRAPAASPDLSFRSGPIGPDRGQDGSSGCSSSAAGPAGCRRRSARPAPGTRSPCSSARPSRADRCGWRRACRTGPSSATWSATRSPSAAGSA